MPPKDDLEQLSGNGYFSRSKQGFEEDTDVGAAVAVHLSIADQHLLNCIKSTALCNICIYIRGGALTQIESSHPGRKLLKQSRFFFSI